MSYFFYFILSTPFWYWLYLGFTGGLGVEPLETLSVQTGYVTLTLLLFNLWLGVGIKLKLSLLKWWYQRRRAIGVASACFAILHFSAYQGQEGFAVQAWQQMLDKTYLTAATAALMVLLALLVTSNDYSVRKLKIKRWKALHRCIHAASIFVMIHIFLIEKGNIPLLLVTVVPLVPFQVWRFIKFIFYSKAKT